MQIWSDNFFEFQSWIIAIEGVKPIFYRPRSDGLTAVFDQFEREYVWPEVEAILAMDWAKMPGRQWDRHRTFMARREARQTIHEVTVRFTVTGSDPREAWAKQHPNFKNPRFTLVGTHNPLGDPFDMPV